MNRQNRCESQSQTPFVRAPLTAKYLICRKKLRKNTSETSCLMSVTSCYPLKVSNFEANSSVKLGHFWPRAPIRRQRLHCRVLADGPTLNRKLTTGAETCLVRSQKKGHSCDFLYRTHAIEG